MQQAVVAAARVAVYALIGTHHLLHSALLHKSLERRQVGFPQVALRQVFYVEAVARLLRPAMHGKVLGAGQQLHVFAVRRALQSAHYGQSHACVHVRVFAVSLLSASPARVAEDIDVGRPERQSLVCCYAPRAPLRRVLGARLVAHGGVDALQQGVVKRCRHAYARGEHRAHAVAAYAVQGFAPPCELRYAEPWNGFRLVHHHYCLLFQRHARAQVNGALVRRQCRVAVWRRLCARADGAGQGHHGQNSPSLHVVVIRFRLCGSTYFVEKFGCEVGSVSPFNCYWGKSVLDEFVSVKQFAEHIACKERTQINSFYCSVVKLQKQFIIFDIVNIYNS